MKILVISNLYPPHAIGGYEERCRQTVDALKERGHTIGVLTSNHQVEGAECVQEEGIARRLKVHGFYGHPWLPIHKLYALEKENHQILREEIQTFQPELIHVWNMGGITKSLLFQLEDLDIPVVYDVSDHWIARSLRADVWLSWWNEPGSAFRSLLRNTLSMSGLRKIISKKLPVKSPYALNWQHMYFCSKFLKDLTLSRGYNVESANVIYCFVDSNNFARKQSYEQVKKLLWVGRLSEDKDPLTAIRALAQLKERGHLDLELDIYGRGDPEYCQMLEDEVKNLSLEGQVNFNVCLVRKCVRSMPSTMHCCLPAIGESLLH